MAAQMDRVPLGSASIKLTTIHLSPKIGGKGEAIPVKAHCLLLIVPGLACLGVWAAGGTLAHFLLVLCVYGPFLWITVTVHELGHAWAASRCGAAPQELLLWPLGGLLSVAVDGQTPRERFLIAVSGPLTHIPMTLLWVFLAWAFAGFHDDGELAEGWYQRKVAEKYGWDWFEELALTMYHMNILMALFNSIVPCWPLDGAVMAVSIGLMCGKPQDKVAAYCIYASAFFGLVIFGYGLYELITGRGGAMWVFMGAWIAQQTYLLFKERKEGRIDAHPLFATPAPRAARPTAEV